MDVVDIEQVQNELVLKAQISNAQNTRGAGKGSNDCLQCGDWNDRAHLGYGACTECTELAKQKQSIPN